MKANGSENTTSFLHLSINEILEKMFNVGTEKPKSFTLNQKMREELVPLILMNTASDNKKAKQKLKSLINPVDAETSENGVLADSQQMVESVISSNGSDTDDLESTTHISTCQSTKNREKIRVKKKEASAGSKTKPVVRSNNINNGSKTTTYDKTSMKDKLPPGWREKFS